MPTGSSRHTLQEPVALAGCTGSRTPSSHSKCAAHRTDPRVSLFRVGAQVSAEAGGGAAEKGVDAFFHSLRVSYLSCG